MIVNAHLGEVTHRLRSGKTRRFRPTGEVYVARSGKIASAEERRDNPIEKQTGSGLAARLFVGLNVGTTATFTLEDVVDAVWTFQRGGASFLIQKGIYQDAGGGRVAEDSVQIVILDFDQRTEEKFLEDMTKLAEHLRETFRQEVVVLEMQKKGVVTDVYSVTP
jgi:hypothetical protein